MSEAAEKPGGPLKIKLAHPLTVDGKPVAEVALDLESLTGADIEQCVREAGAASGQVVVAYEIDVEVHAQIAAKLSGLGRDVFRTMHARDYRKVMSPIRAFFLDSD
jgi:hypothetical protein